VTSDDLRRLDENLDDRLKAIPRFLPVRGKVPWDPTRTRD
jgi:hypothetical protein